mgnify:CR=1 FL=1
MTKWYKYESIEGGVRPVYDAIDRGEDPLRLRIKIKFSEAEDYRKYLKSITAGRMAALLSWRELNSFPEIAAFRDPTPGTVLWFSLMRDFYNDIPTDRTSVLADMGASYRTSEMLIREGIAGGAIVSEADPEDRRRSILFPSIMTVNTYEFVLMPKYLEAVRENVGETGWANTVQILEKLRAWEQIREKHVPKVLRSQIVERQQKINIRMDYDE